MKRLFTLLFASFFVSLGSAQQWIQQVSNTTGTIGSCSFIHPDTGIACPNIFEMLYTHDGGANWNVVSAPNGAGSECFLASSTVAYVIGSNGDGLKSVDGGQSWNVMNTGTGLTLRAIYFLDENTGFWCGQSQKIGKTVDGGLNWTEQDFGAYWLRGIHFESPTTGYVVGEGGFIHKTINTGNSWSTLTTPNTENYYKVHFPAVDTGYVVGGNGTIIKTVDGGSSWNVLVSGTIERLRDLYFFNTQEGYVCGDNGTILHTNDGGINWIPEVSGTIEILMGIDFPSKTVGYVVGSNGTILKKGGGVGIHPSAINNNPFAIYPNPSSGQFTVSSGQLAQKIEIYDLFGRMVLTTTLPQVDMGGYAKGVYFIRVGETVQKLILN